MRKCQGGSVSNVGIPLPLFLEAEFLPGVTLVRIKCPTWISLILMILSNLMRMTIKIMSHSLTKAVALFYAAVLYLR
jgi:hypothetical protein